MSMKRPWMVALLVAACCYGPLALAELTPVDPGTRQDIVFQILAQIANRVTSWEAQVTSAASYLFWTLGTISLAWTMGMMILKRADLGEFFSEFIRFIFFFGLFYGLLRQGPNIARLILESMLQLGQEAAGSTIKYQSFIDIGMELMSRANQFQQSGASKEDAFLVVGLCGGILLMLTTMVINLFLVFVAGWFLMYAGIFFLGFGGSRWTSDIAIGYYKAVIAVGIQMFVMALIMGVATDVLGDFFDKFSFDMRLYELLSFLVATFAFLTIFNRIPALLSGLISGANIGISQGELGGALRGANGADPFGAGRMALGTAFGGAQRLMAAMNTGQNGSQIRTESLMSPVGTNMAPSSIIPKIENSQGKNAQMSAQNSAPQSLGQRPAAADGQGGNGRGFAVPRNPGNAPTNTETSKNISGADPSVDSMLASDNPLGGPPGQPPASLPLENVEPSSAGDIPPSSTAAGASATQTMTAQSAPTSTGSTPSAGSGSGGGDTPASGPGMNGSLEAEDAQLASSTPSQSSLPQEASNSESQSIQNA